MIDIKISTKDNINELMSSRLEMLKVVNDLPEDYEYSEEIINESRDYFLNGDHLTVLAMDDDVVIGCASMSFIRIMPTFEHPTGKRAHLMNVYTRSEYRRKGIARKMVELLIEKTWEKVLQRLVSMLLHWEDHYMKKWDLLIRQSVWY